MGSPARPRRSTPRFCRIKREMEIQCQCASHPHHHYLERRDIPGTAVSKGLKKVTSHMGDGSKGHSHTLCRLGEHTDLQHTLLAQGGASGTPCHVPGELLDSPKWDSPASQLGLACESAERDGATQRPFQHKQPCTSALHSCTAHIPGEVSMACGMTKPVARGARTRCSFLC